MTDEFELDELELELPAEPPIGVYIKVDNESRVVAVASSVFLANTDGWVKVDEGYGDKYAHAQSQYLEQGVRDQHGIYNYELVGNTVHLRDKATDLEALSAEQTKQQRMSEIQSRLQALTEDFVQAECGEIIPDLAERKAEFVALHTELRVLQGKAPRDVAE